MRTEVIKVLRIYDLLLAAAIATISYFIIRILPFDVVFVELIASVIFNVSYVAICLLRCKYHNTKSYFFDRSNITFLSFLFIIFGLILFNNLTFSINELIVSILPKYRDSIMLDLSISIRQMSSGYQILYFVFVVLVVPVYEEVLFRGVLLGKITSKFNPIIGVITVSLLFGILHGDIIGTFGFSILAIILLNRYETLLAPIILHVTNNFFAALNELFMLESEYAVLFNEETQIMWLAIKLVLLIAVCTYFIYLNREYIFRVSLSYR